VASLLACVLVAGGGCGKGTDRLKVSGTVTYKGRPLDQGRIEFEPTFTGPTAFASGAPIADGAFTIPAGGGLAPGTYRVRIYSSDRVSPKGPVLPGSEGPPPKERLAAKYNTETKLTAEVTAAGPNTFAFTVD
jgi:hypothetical protein